MSKKLPAAFYVVAILMFLLPFLTFGYGLDTGKSLSSLSGNPLETMFRDSNSIEMDLNFSIAGHEAILLGFPASKRASKNAQKELSKSAIIMSEDLSTQYGRLGDDPSDSDIKAFEKNIEKSVSALKGPSITVARYYMHGDNEGAVTADLQETLLSPASAQTKKLSYSLILALFACVAGAVIILIGYPKSEIHSMFAGGFAVIVLGVLAILSSSAYTVPGVGKISTGPGLGLVGAAIAIAVGMFLAFRNRDAVVAPAYAPMPIPMPYEQTAPTMTAEPTMARTQVPSPQTIADVPVAVAPAWGATVIEDAGTTSGVFASLRVVAGSGTGRNFDIRAAGETRIGRDAAMNDIVISDGKASGQHSKLRFENNQFTLFDLGSSNGTFVNEQRVTAPVRLKAEDRVKVGDTVLVFQVATV